MPNVRTWLLTSCCLNMGRGDGGSHQLYGPRWPQSDVNHHFQGSLTVGMWHD